MAAVSPTLSQSVLVRSPSTNRQQLGLRNGVHVNEQHSVSPHLQASPTLPSISQSQSSLHISVRCCEQEGAPVHIITEFEQLLQVSNFILVRS